MRALLLSLLLLVETLALKRIVHRIAERKTWKEAQDYCRTHHKDLLTIRDQAEDDEITKNGWIGLKRDNFSSDWRWSNGEVHNSFYEWADGEPDRAQNCGFKKANDVGWHSGLCSERRPFYCAGDPLVLVTEKKTWEEALEHCRQLTRHLPTVLKRHDYDLAAPLDPDVDDTQYVFRENFSKVWIGLRFLAGHWWWMNGQNYEHHRKNCSTVKQCGALAKNATSHIRRNECDNNLYFLCARK